MRSRNHNSEKRSGSVLVLVLGLIAFLAALLVSFLAEATDKMKYHGLLEERGELRVQAYSALEVVLSVLNEFTEIDEKLITPAQGWGNPLEYAGVRFPEGYTVTVEFRDESAKLPLASMDMSQLIELFHQLGLEYMDAEMLTDTLLDWIDEDDDKRLKGFDGRDYDRKDPPYRAANAMPQSWEEFRLIEGFDRFFWDETGRPTPLLARLQESVSLVSTETVNINTAPSLVLATLAQLSGFDARLFEERIAGWDKIRGTADDEILYDGSGLLGEVQPALLGYEVKLLEVNVRVTYGEASFLLSALVSPSSSAVASAETPSQRQPRANTRAAQRAARTANDTTAGGDLNYPFKIHRILENQTL